MRKYIILTLLLACISVGGILWAYIEINGQQDDILVTEMVEAGKKEFAAGIKINTKVLDEEYNLYWNTDMDFDAAGTMGSKTDFVYDRYEDPVEIYQDLEDYYYLSDTFNFHSASYTGLDLKTTTADELGGMPVALIQEAVDEAKEERSATIVRDLDDYMESLPMRLDFSSYEDDANRFEASYAADGRPDWTSYLQYPVPQNFTYEISVETASSGELTHLAIEHAKSEEVWYETNSKGTEDGENLYLAVSAIVDGENGKIISDCPAEKKGIHRIPIVKEEYGSFLDLEQGRVVYPIEAEEQVADLRLSEDGTDIILITKSDYQYTLHVIDKNTMKAKQKQALMRLQESDESIRYSVFRDGWIFLFYEDGGFLLLEEKDGIYRQTIYGSVDGWYYKSGLDCDYDGTRLAIVTLDDEATVIEPVLWIFDKDGCLYKGRYQHTMGPYLNEEDEDSWNYLKRVYVEFTD